MILENDSITKLKTDLNAMRTMVENFGGTVPNNRVVPTPQDIIEGMESLDIAEVTLADATVSDVLVGKTFFSGNASIKTGTKLDYEPAIARFADSSLGNVNLVIPNYCTKIDSNAFAEKQNIVGTVVIPSSVATIGERAFYNCTGITSFQFEGFVTEIGQNGFAKCSGLTGTLTLPEGLITIGASALVSMTNINKVIVPSTVTYVGSNAFSIMTNAVLVLLKPTSVPTFNNSGAFLSSTHKIAVPLDSYSAYHSTTNLTSFISRMCAWKDYTSGDVLSYYIGSPVTWYDSIENLIAGTGGIVSNGSNTATSTGTWFCTI